MTVRRRKWKHASGREHEAWVVDVQAVGKDGRMRRVRRVSAVQTRRAAEKLEHEIREELTQAGAGELADPADVPTLAEFSERFMATYAATNNKPSEVESKRMILRVHLVPELGSCRLGRIGPPEIEAYKAKKLGKKLARKTINNHLTVLRKMLSTAAEWRLLASVPPFKWMKPPPPEFDFLTFDEAHRLIAGADTNWRTMVTVALRTGLRLGELLALRWIDVDLDGGRLIVRRAVSRGVVGTPKNGRSREVPLSRQASAALREHSRSGELVFCDVDGSMLTKGATKWPLWRACCQAGLRRIGWHVARHYRHTFCSHLAMRGASLASIRELAGHQKASTTQRYMHLAPGEKHRAIELLNNREQWVDELLSGRSRRTPRGAQKERSS